MPDPGREGACEVKKIASLKNQLAFGSTIWAFFVYIVGLRSPQLTTLNIKQGKYSKCPKGLPKEQNLTSLLLAFP